MLIFFKNIQTGCVWVFSMPLPNMTRLPDIVTPILPGLMNELMMSYSTSLPIDELASINSTVVAFLSPEKHCAFPVYGLAVWVVISSFVMGLGCFVIGTVTSVVLYFFSSPEVEKVSNVEQSQTTNV